jgi:3-hydroxyisobutyrate dehydrogenase
MPESLQPVHSPRVGFIGIGLMGAPMVERLLERGLHVTVWNRTADKTAPLVALGAERAESARELAERTHIVCLCLTDTNAVDDVVFGRVGVSGVMRAGQLLVDFSSIAPDRTKLMAEHLLETSGADWIDAPVSGGVVGARAGRLIIFAGGDARAVGRATPVFDALSQHVTHMGGHGAGQLAKSCNQMIVACNLMAIAEMLTFARAAGIDASRMPEALAGGFADSKPLQIFGPRMAAGIDTPRIGALATFRKDIEQVVRLAANSGATVPLTARAAELYREAAQHPEVGADAEVSRIIRIFHAGRDAP